MATVSLRKNIDFYRKQLDSFINLDTAEDQLEQLKGLPFYDWQQQGSATFENEYNNLLPRSFNHISDFHIRME